MTETKAASIKHAEYAVLKRMLDAINIAELEPVSIALDFAQRQPERKPEHLAVTIAK